MAALPDDGELVELYAPAAARSATALAFNPDVAGELWVTLRQFPSELPCTSAVRAGCGALEGDAVWLSDATGDAPTFDVKRDGNAWHFMRRPTSIAFGDNGNLATCGEARTDNFEDDPVDYAGPVLWSSSPEIFGVDPEPDQNGTHLDMLHNTPFCMGIAHEGDNVYWAFNGQVGALDRYDFKEPHVIGGEDHSDGEFHRYAEGEVQRVPEVPSHVVIDKERGLLYAADTGNGRVLELDIASGTPAGNAPDNDGLRVRLAMDGASVRDFVSAGSLDRPSGIALADGVLFVTDNATGAISAYDSAGTLLTTFDTGLPAGSLAGIAIGPDGKAYVSDLATGAVYRIEAP